MAGVYFTEHTLVFQQNWIMTSPFKKTHWWMFQLHVTSTTLDTEVINLTHIFWLILSDFQNEPFTHAKKTTAWKVSKYGVFSAPYFPAFGTNTERYSVSLRIHSKWDKVFKNGPSKICGRQNFTRSVLQYFVPNVFKGIQCSWEKIQHCKELQFQD